MIPITCTWTKSHKLHPGLSKFTREISTRSQIRNPSSIHSPNWKPNPTHTKANTATDGGIARTWWHKKPLLLLASAVMLPRHYKQNPQLGGSGNREEWGETEEKRRQAGRGEIAAGVASRVLHAWKRLHLRTGHMIPSMRNLSSFRWEHICVDKIYTIHLSMSQGACA